MMLRRRARTPEKKLQDRKSFLQIRYQITLERYEQMLAEQQHACLICNTPLGEGRRAHIDHDHATGHIRGILCNTCNSGLRHFKDNPDLLAAARAYLLKAGTALDPPAGSAGIRVGDPRPVVEDTTQAAVEGDLQDRVEGPDGGDHDCAARVVEGEIDG